MGCLWEQLEVWELLEPWGQQGTPGINCINVMDQGLALAQIQIRIYFGDIILIFTLI